MEESLSAIEKISNEMYPKIEGSKHDYGTAGFRTVATELPHVVFRMGILASLRSKLKRAAVGVMVTASHNPERDNGVKLIDPHGEMLESSWEVVANKLANSDNLTEDVKALIEMFDVDLDQEAVVFVGRDTRSSSVSLLQAVIDGVRCFSGAVNDFDLVTTPQLHYAVLCRNTDGEYGEATEQGYYTKLSSAFLELRGEDFVRGAYKPKIRLDGANGVGAIKMKVLCRHLKGSLNVEFFNDGSGKLNHMCGADYVKTEQKPAEGVPLDTGVRCVSFDGDGDRIIYSYVSKFGMWRMMDGDRIATLFADYIGKLVKDASLGLDVGLVQTAYANGASTIYAKDKLRIPVVCVPTGVKYVHSAAQKFDVGIYFEANGHGTVLYSKSAKLAIASAASDESAPDRMEAARKLSLLVALTNETVGDAISDLLLVETILHAKSWCIEDWDATYSELYSWQTKVKVNDRKVFRTVDAERRCEEPTGLQQVIDDLVSQVPLARAFARPSGTEDAVRIYAEAATQDGAKKLAYEVSRAVYELAGGVGEEPRQ